MSEQDGTQASTKRRKSRLASKQNGLQAPTLQRPANDDQEAWKEYWRYQGIYWRTEPEIDAERQKYLAQRHSIEPVIEQGIYPFMDIKLSRADVEWLLATHENGRGPIDWSDESQREREGLDLRGADLRRVDLHELPLACLHCGLNTEEIASLPDPIVALEESISANLEGVILSGAHLEGANFYCAHLEGADLSGANLEGAILSGAHLELAFLNSAYLKGALLVDTFLEGASLAYARLDDASLSEARLGRTYLWRAFLGDIHLQGATLSDEKGIGPYLADVRWGDTDLAAVKWSQIKMLGDEDLARQELYTGDWNKEMRIAQYEQAVRANRQLSVVLRNQGLNEDAARFAYRAQMLQRTVFRLQGGARSFLQYLFSGFLDFLSGYGYKPGRSFCAYLLVITAFAIAYFIIGHTVGPVLSPLGSFVFSMTSFHGRGFFPGGITLDDPLTIFAAFEAFFGLIIEVTFIATLTQRLFGK